ncbi:DUF5050 domain-containing protein [Vallitalea okinawensis]|uniref:DUF5050 domain-containing protein n=1 Tax=Vallitalea okinawensis TaxID=2078660 RepID=UPI000CFA99FB|nr:DUF5050 domain-containing protein [Vallitalea okinawensis]
MKKYLFLFFLVALFLLIPNKVLAKSYVTVSISDYDIYLNDVKVNNSTSEYPFITYKNITYFPLTFNDSRFLGLETEWSLDKGLFIENTGIVSEYKGYKTTNVNANHYQASVANFQITVNGKIIDNSKEEYPILLFRDVTYFPLTWRFIVDEFNWSYEFDPSMGLYIESQNLSPKVLELPFQLKGMSGIDIVDGYYYYVGEDEKEGYIYRAPIGDISNAAKVQKIESRDDYYNPLVSAYKKDSEVYVSYHVGGMVMGKDVYCRVNDSGVGEEIISGYLDFTIDGDDMAMVNYRVPPSSGNLSITNSRIEKQIGDSSLMYGWIRSGTSYLHGGDIEIIDGWVYINAFNESDESIPNNLYKINIATNESTVVSNLPLRSFSIVDNYVYILNSENGKLYRTTLMGGEEELLIDTPINTYYIDDDTIYYITDENNVLYRQKSDGTSEILLSQHSVESVKVVDDYLICALNSDDNYGLIILDKKGNQIFKTLDMVIHNSYYDNKVTYFIYESQTNYIIELPE